MCWRVCHVNVAPLFDWAEFVHPKRCNNHRVDEPSRKRRGKELRETMQWPRIRGVQGMLEGMQKQNPCYSVCGRACFNHLNQSLGRCVDLGMGKCGCETCCRRAFSLDKISLSLFHRDMAT